MGTIIPLQIPTNEPGQHSGNDDAKLGKERKCFRDEHNRQANVQPVEVFKWRNEPHDCLYTSFNFGRYSCGFKIKVLCRAIIHYTLRYNCSYNEIGNMTSNTDTIQHLTYDDFGHVIKNDRSGTSGDMSYSYDNLHGWLKQIKANSKYGGFEQNLYRETGSSTPCYNGSISAMTWKNISDYLRRYDYKYDGLNRMTRAKFRYYKIGAGSSGSLTYTLLPSGGYGKQEDYSVDYEYDKNTNVSSIYRQGRLTIGDGDGYDTVEDDYIERNGNQLKKYDPCSVGEPYYGNFDFVNGADEDVEYSYDGNGNLTVDKNKGLTFSYDLLGHLIKASSATADIDYVYAADGTKLQVSHKQYSTSSKKGTPKTSTSETYYGNLIYKNGKVSRYNFDGGFLSFNSKGSLSQSSCHLYIKDYQGNNRMLVNADNNGIEQNTHYYPYGELISDISTNPDGQDYKYGGKELDRTYGLDLYDFHARQLDSKLGCFTSIDPMAEKYYGISPYAYCAGDPVNCIDPDGENYFRVNENGFITEEINDSPDKIVGINKNGKEEFRCLNEYQSDFLRDLITNQNEDITSAVSSMSSDYRALDLFKDLSDFSNVEWSLTKSEDGKFIMTTNHAKGEVDGPELGTYQWDIHSHPGDIGFEGTRGASGDKGLSSDGQVVYINGDMNNVKTKTSTWTRDWGKSHSTFPMHYVYHKKSGSTYFYNAYKNNFKCNLHDVGKFRKDYL